jgi:hypothetical protein
MHIDPNAPMAKFALGQIYITPGADQAIEESGETPRTFLCRHQTGDWGDLGQEDQEANDRAVAGKERIFSAYHTERGVKIWVITEWDRSITTILLPQEY